MHVYVCIYIYIHVYIHIYIYIYIHNTYIHHTYVYMYILTYTQKETGEGGSLRSSLVRFQACVVAERSGSPVSNSRQMAKLNAEMQIV